MEQQQEPQFSREESANRISRLIAKISRVHCNCVNERLQPLGLTNLTSTHLINISAPPRDEPKRVGLPPVGESKVMVSKTLKQLEQGKALSPAFLTRKTSASCTCACDPQGRAGPGEHRHPAGDHLPGCQHPHPRGSASVWKTSLMRYWSTFLPSWKKPLILRAEKIPVSQLGGGDCLYSIVCPRLSKPGGGPAGRCRLTPFGCRCRC